jgi:excisionase family DNA binding protein
MSEQLLSPEGLSQELGVPVRTLYQWRYRGDGPPGFRVGRHLRYRRRDVDAWLEERAAGAAEDARRRRDRWPGAEHRAGIAESGRGAGSKSSGA